MAWALEAEDPHLSHSFATCLMITLGNLHASVFSSVRCGNNSIYHTGIL